MWRVEPKKGESAVLTTEGKELEDLAKKVTLDKSLLDLARKRTW